MQVSTRTVELYQMGVLCTDGRNGYSLAAARILDSLIRFVRSVEAKFDKTSLNTVRFRSPTCPEQACETTMLNSSLEICN